MYIDDTVIQEMTLIEFKLKEQLCSQFQTKEPRCLGPINRRYCSFSKEI